MPGTREGFARTLGGARLQTGYSVSGLSLAELAQKGESWGWTTAKAPSPESRALGGWSQWECLGRSAASPLPPSYKSVGRLLGKRGTQMCDVASL